MRRFPAWIGGAAAALVLTFSGATLASVVLPKKPAAEAAKIDAEIPVDPAAFDEEASTEGVAPAQFVTGEVAQPVPEPPAMPKKQAVVPKEEPFVIKRILDIDGPIKYGEWYWDDEGVPDGALVMTVDLDARVISVFRGGYEIGAAAALLGTEEHPTPLGTFPILRKQRHNVSEKYNNAPMPWSMFLTGDGVAIHGGSQVENGYASHGCISIPDELASRIFAIAKPGDKVVITRGKMLQMGDRIL